MTEQMNVPKLRFNGFDSDWSVDLVGAVFNIKAGGDIDKEHVSENQSETYPYPIFANAEKNKGLYGYSDLFKVEPPCLTVAGRGVNIGIAHARFEPFYPIVRLLTLKPKSEQDIKFHEYIFNNLNIFVESTGVPQLTGPQISSYRLSYPSYVEQQKIASFLSKVDEKIALLTEKKVKLTEYKKGVIQQLFDGSFQEQDGKLVFVPPTLRFKADDGSEFPDWEEVSLGSITTAMQSGISRQLHSEDIGYPILRSNNLSEGKVSFEDLKYWHLTDDQGADLTRYILEEGDLLVNFINSLSQIGKVAIYYNSMGRDVIYTTNIMRLKFNSMITSEFAFYSFNTRRYVNFIQSIAKPAVSQASFTTVDFKKYKMHVPTRAEQNKMTSLLLAIDKKIELINTELEKAKEWKKGLLQQMFV